MSDKDLAIRSTIAAGSDLFIGFVRFDPRRVGVAAALMLAAALSESVSLALLAPMLAILTGQGGGTIQRLADAGFARAAIVGPEAKLTVLMAILVAAIAVRALLVGMRDRQLHDLQLDFVDSRRVALIRRLGASRWRDIVSLRHARITQALAGEIPRVAMAVHVMLTIGVATVMLLAQGALIAVLAPGLGMLAVGAMIVAACLSAPLIRRAYALGTIGQNRNLKLVDIAAQLLGGLKLALAQNLAGAFVAEFEDTLRDHAHEQRDFDRRRVRAQAASTVGAAVALAGLVVVGHRWGMPAATLLAAIAILSRMVGPATGILRDLRMLAQALPSHLGLRALEAELSRTVRKPAAAASTDFGDGTIRFDRVAFAHPGGAGVRDCTFQVAPGEAIGIVGPSGAGKTTLADLLTGLLSPDRGRITVGGVVLEDDAIDAWRDRIAYVAQDGFLFHDTVRRNLCWGRGDLPDDALWAALERAGAGDLVRRIDGGLDAVVAERGTRFSGGERQRLALARALLRRPQLLILDEATNANEVAMEDPILAALAADLARPTIILITHRPEPLRHCTRVLRLDPGEPIVECAHDATERA